MEIFDLVAQPTPKHSFDHFQRWNISAYNPWYDGYRMPISTALRMKGQFLGLLWPTVLHRRACGLHPG
jgi:hypothetical protein